MIRLLILIHLFFLSNLRVKAQYLSSDSVRHLILKTPAFSSYKDNYFILGVPTDHTPDANNSTIKYQISFKQRLTNAVLPFKTYLYMTYTQKSIWRIFAYSSPFAESNYNPVLGIGKAVLYKEQFRGIAALTFEHESNGRDGTLSRSWNKLAAHYMLPLSHRSMVSFHAWLPIDVASENADLMKFIGYGEASFHYVSPQKRISIDITGRKGAAWDWRGSLEGQINYRLGRESNQYLGIQWFKGFSETLIVYNQPISMIRVGLMIKPAQFFVF